MKALPGIFALSLLLAAVSATSVLAQEDGGGLVFLSEGGGSTFGGTISNAGVGADTLSLGGASTVSIGYYTGGATLTLASASTYLGYPSTILQRLGNNTNVPVLPTSLWPVLFGSPTTTPGGTLTTGGTLSLSLGSPVTVLPYGGTLNLGSTSLGTIILGSAIGATLVVGQTNTASGILTLNYAGAYTVAATINAGTLVLNGTTGNIVGGVIQTAGTGGTLQIAPSSQLAAQTNNPAELTPTPEPSAAVLLAFGLAVPLWRARKRLGLA